MFVSHFRRSKCIELCHADTEGSFMVDRVVEIADACVRHLKKLANNNGTAAQKEAVCNPPSFTIFGDWATQLGRCLWQRSLGESQTHVILLNICADTIRINRTALQVPVCSSLAITGVPA